MRSRRKHRIVDLVAEKTRSKILGKACMNKTRGHVITGDDRFSIIELSPSSQNRNPFPPCCLRSVLFSALRRPDLLLLQWSTAITPRPEGRCNFSRSTSPRKFCHIWATPERPRPSVASSPPCSGKFCRKTFFPPLMSFFPLSLRYCSDRSSHRTITITIEVATRDTRTHLCTVDEHRARHIRDQQLPASQNQFHLLVGLLIKELKLFAKSILPWCSPIVIFRSCPRTGGEILI